MTEPATRQRQAVDLDEFERRLRAVAPTSKPAEDPLAELARLVGQDDPFKQVFAESVRSGTVRPEPRSEAVRAEPVRTLRKEPSLNAVPDTRPGSPGFAELRAASGEPNRGEPIAPQPPYWERNRDAEAAEARQNETFYGPDQGAARPAAHAAYDDSEPWLADDAQLPAAARKAAPGAGSRRGLFALAGVAGLALVTVAVLYTFKGAGIMSAMGVMGTTEPPTIKAASGPAKVAPANQTLDATDQDSSVLDRPAADVAQPTKVVTREEQPVDLDQANNTAPPRTEEVAANPTAPSMEPKKVKTVTVRPDGTIVSDDGSAQARSLAPMPAQSPLISNAPNPVNPPVAGKSQDAGNSAPSPKSATPKTTVRIASTPKAGSNGGPIQSSKAKPKAVAPPVAPTVVADADPAQQPQAADTMPTGATGAAAPSDTAGAAGTFAVQLAAPASEQEARDLSARLQKKFATELSGYHPAIHRADAAGHQVYRVRVGNLSRDDAVSLCEKLKAGGGACFIAKN